MADDGCRCWNEGQWGRVHREDCPVHGEPEPSRWQPFGDRELREVYLALATAPSAGTMRSHGMIAEINVEANSRGEERARAILDG